MAPLHVATLTVQRVPLYHFMKPIPSILYMCIMFQVSHYVDGECGQASVLKQLSKSLKGRCSSLQQLVIEKLQIISASLDFHQNMKNVF